MLLSAAEDERVALLGVLPQIGLEEAGERGAARVEPRLGISADGWQRLVDADHLAVSL